MNFSFFVVFVILLSSIAIAEDRDLYVFVINGDNYRKELDQYTGPCPDDQADCSPQGYIKKTFSKTVLQKAIDFSKHCTSCDVLIDYTKFEKIKKQGRKRKSAQREQIFVYRDGVLIEEKSFKSLEPSRLVLVPVIGTVRRLTRYKKLKRARNIFLKALGASDYRKQFAFVYGHKVPDRTRRMYFASSPFLRYSLPHLLKELESLSFKIQNQKKKFDLLFLGYCLSSVETIHTVLQSKTSHFTLASPELIPLVGLAELDIRSLGNHLKDEDTGEAVEAWLQKSFDPHAEENVSEKIMASHYALSLYDMEQLELLNEDFSLIINALKALKKKQRNAKKDLETLATTGDSQKSRSMDFMNPANYDCQRDPVLAELIAPLAPAVSSFYQKKSFIDVLLDRDPPEEASHSGLSCL